MIPCGDGFPQGCTAFQAATGVASGDVSLRCQRQYLCRASRRQVAAWIDDFQVTNVGVKLVGVWAKFGDATSLHSICFNDQAPAMFNMDGILARKAFGLCDWMDSQLSHSTSCEAPLSRNGQGASRCVA